MRRLVLLFIALPLLILVPAHLVLSTERSSPDPRLVSMAPAQALVPSHREVAATTEEREPIHGIVIRTELRALGPGTGPVRVPVLLYHHLEPGARGENGAVISPGEFEEQMGWLASNGYTAISTAELAAWLSGTGSLPPRPVLITFDDGYRSNYRYAYPVLKRFGLRAVIFMVTGFAGSRHGGLEYLDWHELLELSHSGVVEVAAHTHDGHRRVGESPALLAWSAREIAADLTQLRRAFADAGMPNPTAFAYPFGAHDSEAIESLVSGGIALGFTVEHGYVQRGDPPMGLRRLIVYPGTGLCRFGTLVTGSQAESCQD